MECIFEEYIKFVNDFLITYYKLLLNTKYEKNLVRPFIDKYIDVRYYNKSEINEEDFTERLNKELNNVVIKVMEENESKSEKIKNIFALFSYVLFIDGCVYYSDFNALLKTLYSDKNIKLVYSDETKKELNELIKDFMNKKLSFFKICKSKEFFLVGKELDKSIYHIDLDHNCNLGKLYSEYAINKAYNSSVVFENRTYLAILLTSVKILSEVMSLDFSKYYIIDFPVSLVEKPKKIIRFLKAVDNDMLRTKISLKIKYKDYTENKKAVHHLIKEGYSMCLELDETYSTNFDNLFLFSYVLVSKKYNYYDIIINSKEDVKTKIITL